MLSSVILSREGHLYLKHWYWTFNRVIISKQVGFKNIR